MIREGGPPTTGELEAQTRAAHRAYLDALEAWEQALQQLAAATERGSAREIETHTNACNNAELEKERRRIVFRDLCDALGHIPSLAQEGNSSDRQDSAGTDRRARAVDRNEALR